MQQLTNKSIFKQGDKVTGVYCGVIISGTLNSNCRPTPDHKNMIFGVTLDNPITIFGRERTTVEIDTNPNDAIEMKLFKS